MTDFHVINLYFMISIAVQVSSQVLQTGNGIGVPELINYRGIDNDNRLPHHTQGIIYTYSFNSCGNITAWGADVHQDNRYSLDFQIWRPSPTVNNSTGTGCYSLVGNNRFTSITLSGGVARVTPSPQDYIQFQPNDVLGFYIESASIRRSGENPNGLVLQTSPSRFTSELLWYASIAPTMATSQNGACPYSVGSNGVLNTSTRAAPVISINATTFSCVSRPSSTPLKPTSTSTTTPPINESISPRQTTSSSTITNTLVPPGVVPASVESISPHQTTTNMDSNISTVSTQTPWLLIGSITAALVIVIVLTASLAVVITVCCLKGKSKKEVLTSQSVTSNDEHHYDYVHHFTGCAPQTVSSNYSKMAGDYLPAETIGTLKRNEAYTMSSRRSMSIEASQNVAYHSALDML